MQTPPARVQGMPQPPQFFTSVMVSEQMPPSHSIGLLEGQLHELIAHSLPPVQALPQPLQLRASFAVSTHSTGAPVQRVTVGGAALQVQLPAEQVPRPQ